MADLGKVTPTKPVWSRVGETMPENNNPHPQPHPENDNKKGEDEKSDSNETPEDEKKPSDPDDEHQIDIFV